MEKISTPSGDTSQEPREDSGTVGEKVGASPEAETAVAAYLRSLKSSQKHSGAAAGNAGTPAPQIAGAPGGRERRRSIRYKCEGSAEFRVEGSEVRAWGALHDISLHGCYLEAAAAAPVGTILNLLLEVNRIRVRVKGEVRVSYPNGMGIAYTDIAEEERAYLRKLLSSLSESEGAEPTPQRGMQAGKSQSMGMPITNAAAAVQAIVLFFQNRSMLSRQDFWELIRKSQSGTR
jgi:PilZ domain-containing protein